MISRPSADDLKPLQLLDADGYEQFLGTLDE